jgi:hypothetical protein
MLTETMNKIPVRTLRSADGRFTVESDMTHETALARLRDMVQGRAPIDDRNKEFAESLVQQFDTRSRLSEAQWFWVHKLVIQAIESAAKPPARKIDLGDFTRLIELFQAASQHLKYPKVRLLAGETPVVLYVTGPKSKQPGSINVVGQSGSDRWYGRIGRGGQFSPSRECTPAIEQLLQQFAADPAGTAALYAKATGNCSFCGRELTDERSIVVGRGPVCSEKFGLPWGEVE